MKEWPLEIYFDCSKIILFILYYEITLMYIMYLNIDIIINVSIMMIWPIQIQRASTYAISWNLKSCKSYHI